MSATVNFPFATVSNLELVSRVLRSYAGYFRKQRLAYGVAPFKLDDAYSEVRVQALRYADSFDPARSHVLGEREQAVLAVEGLGVLHQRVSNVAAKAHCDALELTPTGLRKLVTRLRSKACRVATEHFGANALKGRPAGPKPVRREVAVPCA